jgi:hypothetical protein
VLQSTSRLFADLAAREERELAATVTEHLALHERNRAMVDIGAYKTGGNPQLDRTLEVDAGVATLPAPGRRAIGWAAPRRLLGLRSILKPKAAA